MTIQQILDAVMALEQEIDLTPPGAPEFAAIVAHITELQGALDRVRSVQGPLVPDSSRPKSPDEESAISLDHALRSLMAVATAKR